MRLAVGQDFMSGNGMRSDLNQHLEVKVISAGAREFYSSWFYVISTTIFRLFLIAIGGWLCSVNDFLIFQMESDTHAQTKQWLAKAFRVTILNPYKIVPLWLSHLRISWSYLN